MDNPVKRETILTSKTGENGLAPRPVSAVQVALITVGSLLALAAVGGAAVAVFNVTMSVVTMIAFGVAALAVIVLLPMIMFALNAVRIRGLEEVARAMPLEALILQRRKFEELIETKSSQLQEANGHLADFRRLINDNRKEMDQEDIEAWEQNLAKSEEAFEQAQVHLVSLRGDLDDFDRQIKKAKIDDQIAQAQGKVAASMKQLEISAEDRHVNESALSAIAQRAGRNAELLDQALAAGNERQQRRGN